MANDSEGRIRWGRYGLEAFIIVSSILLAFAVEAMWQYRLDRVREREYLESLYGEFGASLQELESDQAVRERILTRVESLIAFTRGEVDPQLLPDSLAHWLTALIDYRFYTPVHSVLDDLISSGNLGLIRSDSLRFAIMDYDQERERLQVVEELERSFMAEQIEPFLAARLRLSDYLANYALLSSDSVLRTPGLEDAKVSALLQDPEFASLIFLRHDRTDTSWRFGQGVRRTILNVRRQIENALDRGQEPGQSSSTL